MTIDASKLTLLDEGIRTFNTNIFKYHPNEAVYLQSLVDIVVKGRRKKEDESPWTGDSVLGGYSC